MKIYVVLLCEYDEDGSGQYSSVEVAYVTCDSDKAQNIQTLWDIVQKHQHESFQNHKMENALKELKNQYHIITWSGAELRIEERELL